LTILAGFHKPDWFAWIVLPKKRYFAVFVAQRSLECAPLYDITLQIDIIENRRVAFERPLSIKRFKFELE
jgi:hypothetical protein